MDVLTGDTTYMEIFKRMEPFKPNVTLSALPEEDTTFASAAPQKKVTMRAYLRQGGTARYLMLEYLSVEK
jgi:hypothetical protein